MDHRGEEKREGEGKNRDSKKVEWSGGGGGLCSRWKEGEEEERES